MTQDSIPGRRRRFSAPSHLPGRAYRRRNPYGIPRVDWKKFPLDV